MADRYPLQWPDGWPRTARRGRARFDTTFDRARKGIVRELERLGARSIVLSTNIELRRDGYPYASAKAPDDPGVAVYFFYNGKQSCIPCDKWDRVQDNLRAIEKTIEAMRGLERWGAKSIIDKAFTGFESLPPPVDAHGAKPHEVLNVPENADVETVRAARMKLAKVYHPDAGTQPNHDRMAAVNAAADAMLNAL